MGGSDIHTLHEEASEYYLRGEYREALAAWRRILEIDPNDEQAHEGVRLSGMLAEGAPVGGPAEDPAEASDEALLDEKLSILGGSDPPPAPAASRHAGDETVLMDRETVRSVMEAEGDVTPPAAGPAVDPDPDRQDEGIDLGDPNEVEAIPLAGTPAPPIRQDESGTDLPERPPEPEFSGLAPVVEGGGIGAAPPIPSSGPVGRFNASDAAAELGRRIGALIAQAREAAAGGRHDEALGILSRVFILDDENEQARRLEEDVRASMGRQHSELEQLLQGAVQDFELDRLSEAERAFREVLELSPMHQEARDYLSRIEARRTTRRSAGVEPAEASPEENLLGDIDLAASDGSESTGARSIEAGPSVEAVPLAIPVDAPSPSAVAETPRVRRSRPAPTGPAPVMPLRVGLAHILVASALLAALTIGAGFIAVRRGLAAMEAMAGSAMTEEALAAQGGGGPGGEGVASSGPSHAQPTGPPPSPETIARVLPGKLRRAKLLHDAERYGEAVIAYNEVLSLVPDHPQALRGLLAAGEAYRVQQAEQHEVDRARMAFQDQEFTSGLRILYRLPASVDPKLVDRYKVNGWYNLGLVAMKAGDCRSATRHFDEALGIDPDEAGVRASRELAESYLDRPKDRLYYAEVEAMTFRAMED